MTNQRPTGQNAPRNILIVGGGYIGSAIARTALARGSGVRILTRSVATPLEFEKRAGAEVIIADASDRAIVTSSMRGVDHVFYTVGDLRTGIADSGPGGDLTRAIPPLMSTLEACRAQPGGRLTFLSSGGTIYGEALDLPIGEDHPTEPLVAYGIMKLTCEKFVGLYSTLYGVNARIARCANAFGEGQPGDRPQGVIAAFLHRVARAESIAMFGDGSVIRDFIHVNDLAAALLDLHAAPALPRVVNIGSGNGTSLKELLRLIEDVTGRPVNVTWQPARQFDVQRNVLNISRLRSLIGFEPLTLEQGIRLTWEQQLEHIEAPSATAAGEA